MFVLIVVCRIFYQISRKFLKLLHAIDNRKYAFDWFLSVWLRGFECVCVFVFVSVHGHCDVQNKLCLNVCEQFMV